MATLFNGFLIACDNNRTITHSGRGGSSPSLTLSLFHWTLLQSSLLHSRDTRAMFHSFANTSSTHESNAPTPAPIHTPIRLLALGVGMEWVYSCHSLHSLPTPCTVSQSSWCNMQSGSFAKHKQHSTRTYYSVLQRMNI